MASLLKAILASRDYQIESIRNNNIKLQNWLEQLCSGISVLFESKRWKNADFLGEFKRRILLKSKTNMPKDYIEKTMMNFNNWQKEVSNNFYIYQNCPIDTNTKFCFKSPVKTEDYQKLTSWIQLLAKYSYCLINSKDWEVGNTIGSVKNKITLRKQEQTPVDKLMDTLSEYEFLSRYEIEPIEYEKIICLMNRLDEYLQVIIQSKRWRTGTSIINKLHKFTFNNSSSSEYETRIIAILDDYRLWKEQKQI